MSPRRTVRLLVPTPRRSTIRNGLGGLYAAFCNKSSRTEANLFRQGFFGFAPHPSCSPKFKGLDPAFNRATVWFSLLTNTYNDDKKRQTLCYSPIPPPQHHRSSCISSSIVRRLLVVVVGLVKYASIPFFSLGRPQRRSGQYYYTSI
jgi:hypothetical protein